MTTQLNSVPPPTPTAHELAQAIRAGFESRCFLAAIAFGPARAASVVTEARKTLLGQGNVAAYPPVAKPGPLAAIIRGLRRAAYTLIRPWLAVQSDYNRLITEILEIHGTEIALLTQRLDHAPSPQASLRACGFPNPRPPDAPAD